MLSRLALAVLFLAAGTAQAQTLTGEVGGPTGGYAIGLEQTVLRAVDDERRLSLRAGVGVWSGEGVLSEPRGETTLRAPIGATASLSLGTPLGIPTRFESSAGIVFEVVRDLSRGQISGGDYRFARPAFGEVVVRAEPGRWAVVRAGVAVGGRITPFDVSEVGPVLGVGVRL